MIPSSGADARRLHLRLTPAGRREFAPLDAARRQALLAAMSAIRRAVDPARERCWIAARHGHCVGCILLVAGEGGSAQLRLLLVEPQARARGLGALRAHREKAHHSFGHDLLGETWELSLAADASVPAVRRALRAVQPL